jgi:hypothetical protein
VHLSPSILTSLFNPAYQWYQHRVHVRALAHRGYFRTPGSPEFVFIKVTNLSRDRDIEITHIWFDTKPRVDILDFPLPAHVRPAKTYEIWKPVAELSDDPNIEQLGRVVLSDGKIIKTKLNKDVPPVGYVAGPKNA